MPQRPGTLPAAPGLPQRPAFGAPPVNAAEMQQMHQGQLKGPSNQPPLPVAKASTLDDLVSNAANDADKAASTGEVKIPGVEAGAGVEEKKSKKDKDKGKLIYSDNDVSPEEKMAQLPRYAFAPAA